MPEDRARNCVSFQSQEYNPVFFHCTHKHQKDAPFSFNVLLRSFCYSLIFSLIIITADFNINVLSSQRSRLVARRNKAKASRLQPGVRRFCIISILPQLTLFNRRWIMLKFIGRKGGHVESLPNHGHILEATNCNIFVCFPEKPDSIFTAPVITANT